MPSVWDKYWAQLREGDTDEGSPLELEPLEGEVPEPAGDTDAELGKAGAEKPGDGIPAGPIRTSLVDRFLKEFGG